MNPEDITPELRERITAVKNRILFLSPSVTSGEEAECRKEDFESLANSNIGVGGFGKVYKVRHKRSQNVYAVKVINKSKILENDLAAQVKLELRIMYQLNHEYVIKLYNHFEDGFCLGTCIAKQQQIQRSKIHIVICVSKASSFIPCKCMCRA